MKKKIIVLIAVLLCAVMLLCSCSDSLKFKKMYDKKAEFVDETPTLNSAAALDIEGYVAQQAGDLVVVYGFDEAADNDTVTVFNVASGQTVWSATNAEKVSYEVALKEIWGTTLILKGKMTMPETPDEDMTMDIELCAIDGTPFWAKAGMTEDEGEELEALFSWFTEDGRYYGNYNSYEFYQALDLIGIKGELFRIADGGSVSKMMDYAPLAGLPSFNYTINDYYYVIEENSVAIYDAELQLVTLEIIPGYAASAMMPASTRMMISTGGAFITVLNNGNVLIQYSYYADEYAEDYTYMDDDGNKYIMETKVITAKNGKVKEIKKCEYVFMYAIARDAKLDMEGDYNREPAWAYVGLNNKIENVVIAFPFENQRLSMEGDAYLNMKFLSMSNKGKIEGTLDGAIPNQIIESYLVAPGRWLVADQTMRIFLLDAKGKIVGEITNYDTLTNNYVLCASKLYNLDLVEVADLEELKCDHILLETDEGVIFEDEDGAVKMVMADGAVKTLIEATDETKEFEEIDDWYSEIFVIWEEGDSGYYKATIYNAAGNVIYTAENVDGIDVVAEAESNGNILLEVVVVDAEYNYNEVLVLCKP